MPGIIAGLLCVAVAGGTLACMRGLTDLSGKTPALVAPATAIAAVALGLLLGKL